MKARKVEVLCVISVIALSSCGGGGSLRHSRAVFSRACVVEFADRTPYKGTGEQFARALRDALEEAGMADDVIYLSSAELPSIGDPVKRAVIPLSVLAKLRREYRVDALVVGSVDEYNPYQRVSIHVNVKVVDTASAVLLYRYAGGWDAGRKETAARIRAYYRRNRERDGFRFGPDIFFISPRYFFRFVSDELAARMCAGVRRRLR